MRAGIADTSRRNASDGCGEQTRACENSRKSQLASHPLRMDHPSPPEPFAVVRVVAIRSDRFADAKIWHRRLPRIGDVGTVIETYASPAPSCEVECSDPETGETIWLEAMHLDEIEPVLP